MPVRAIFIVQSLRVSAVAVAIKIWSSHAVYHCTRQDFGTHDAVDRSFMVAVFE